MDKKLSIEFGKTIRKFRLSKGLSQEQLGFKADVHRTYVGMIERGEKNITLENIKKFCHGLDITMQQLFSEFNESQDECDLYRTGV